MQQSFNVLSKVTFLTGSADIVNKLNDTPAKVPFSYEVTEFLNEVSRELMSGKETKAYSDVITFAFWIRKGSVQKLKERFEKKDDGIHLGKGVVFHIAPSNVPVNFAYSLVTGLLTGNCNVVRVPSKDFPQVALIIEAINKALDKHENMRPYVICVRYDRDRDINDMFSAMADMRVIWGGDQTIVELRRSPLPPRSGEITFADRYSIAVIDSDCYMDIDDKTRVAEDFYNDTFFTDQNACTSPRVVVWTGNKIAEAKEVFWEEEHKLVKKKYSFQPIQGVNKLTQLYLAAAAQDVKSVPREDNLIYRVSIREINEEIMKYRDNSGYFYEYECDNIMEIKALCDDKRCQTIAYIGDSNIIRPLIEAGVKGVDRVVPVGKTMDFDMIWDGYDLFTELTRRVVLA